MEKSVKNCALNSNNNKALRRCNYDTKQQQLLDLSWVELEQVIYLLNAKFADKNKAANHVSIVMFLMNVECSAFFLMSYLILHSGIFSLRLGRWAALQLDFSIHSQFVLFFSSRHVACHTTRRKNQWFISF